MFQAYRHFELSNGYMPKDGLSLIQMDYFSSLVGHTSFCLLVAGS